MAKKSNIDEGAGKPKKRAVTPGVKRVAKPKEASSTASRKPAERKPVKSRSSGFVVRGQVLQGGKPYPGALVRAVDQDRRGENPLGEPTLTDKQGRYEIRYTEEQFRRSTKEIGGPDLIVRVCSAEGKIMAQSKRKSNANQEETVNLTVGSEESFVVSGIVRRSDGRPAAGALVRAYDQDLRKKQLLGKKVTDAKGQYEISYSPRKFLRAEKASADLRVVVVDAKGKELTASDVQYNAPAEAAVDLTLPLDGQTLSEFEILLRDIQPLLAGQGKAGADLKISELDEKDIAFLSQETGQPQERIAFLLAAVKAALAMLSSSGLKVKSLVSKLQGPAIRVEAFYGWFRQGLPTPLPELLVQDMQGLRAALERSAHDNIIPMLSDRELDEIINKLATLKADLILKPADKNQPASLGDLLKTTRLSPEKQRRVAELQVEHAGASEEFWKALTEGKKLSTKEVSELRLTLQLGTLTGNHLPLILELKRAAPGDRTAARVKSVHSSEVGQPQGIESVDLSVNELRPFAGLDVTDWKAILQRPAADGKPIGTPPTIPGADLQEKIDNYAVDLNQTIENLLPTAVIASRLEKDTADDSPFKSVQPDLKTFFDNNASFEFGATPVELYLREGRDQKLSNVTDPEALLVQLKNLERVFKITPAPRYPKIRALLSDDLHSALAMVHVGERRFTEKYAEPLGGPSQALEVYRKAEHVHATALNVYMKYGAGFNSPSPYVISGGKMGGLVPRGNSTDSIGSFGSASMAFYRLASTASDWRTSFGPLDLCDCEHCKSLYSPAAYLVDILKFLHDGQIIGNMSPLQALLARRPDIANTELTCENTNTPLPYVDLVNEVLEEALMPTPIGHWDFDEGQGKTAHDASFNGNNGTLKALSGSGPIWQTGKIGTNALGFNGSNDYVQIPAMEGQRLIDTGSICAWIYPKGVGSLSPRGTIIANEDDFVISWQLSSNGGAIDWRFPNRQPAEQWHAAGGYIAPVNEWTHIAVVFDKGKVKTYANGQLVDDASGTGSIGLDSAQPKEITVGGRPGMPQYFYGLIDDVRLYDRALGNEEVRISAEARPSRQTRGTAEELAANPEYINTTAYYQLSKAVYPWSLPLNLWMEEARVYLNHLGVKRHEVMETLFKGTRSAQLTNNDIAREVLGLTQTEAGIIMGTITHDMRPVIGGQSDRPWDFWGLLQSGNDIPDPSDDTALHAQGDWDVVLQRVSIFLQKSGLSYKELLELLGSYFINPPASAGTPGGRLFGIVSTDSKDPTTCHLSELEIQVIDKAIPEADKKDKLIAVWNKCHRFVRLGRKLGWTMRDLDQTITAFNPANLNDGFLTQLSHIQRLRKDFDLPLVNMLSWWSDIGTASYIDQLADGQPEVVSLYKQLFRNKTVIKPLDEAYTEDASQLTGKISDHLPTLVAALGISAADLSLLLGLTQSIPQQTVTAAVYGLGVDRTRSHEPMFVLDLGRVATADNQFTIKFQESNDDIAYNDIPDVNLPGGGQPGVIDQTNDDQVIRRRYLGTKSFLRVAVTTVQGTSPRSLPMSAQVVLGYGKVSDELSLANLSLLYRISSLAKALKLSIRELLTVKALTEIDPFATTDVTLRFVEKVDVIRASGFSIDELNYLLRHDFGPASGIAPAEDAIAVFLDELRGELQKIAAENTVHEDPGDPDGVTTDPGGELTRKKLALLNWDTALIEQVVATFNGSLTYEALTDTLLTGLVLPNDTGTYEVDLASLPTGFTFPGELAGVVTSVPKFLFACDSGIPIESTPGIISTALKDKFTAKSIALGPNPTVTTETPDTNWKINGQYSVVKNGGIFSVYDLHDLKLRASRLLSKPERDLLRNLAVNSNDNGLINATGGLFDLQDQLQGQITYEQVVVNGQPKGRLRFTGSMTNARKTRLDSVSGVQAYLDAVQALYDAPRNFIARYMRTFAIQDFATDLAALPDSVKFPNVLKSKVYFDAAAEPQKLHFMGVMTDQEHQTLSGFSTEPAYQAAVDNLFNKPLDFSTDLAVLPTGVAFPSALRSKVYFDAAAEPKQLHFIGVMTDQEYQMLFGLSNDTSYRAAVKNLFNKPQDYATDLAVLPTGVAFPNALKDQVYFEAAAEPKQLHFIGVMTDQDHQTLLGLSTDTSYRAAVDSLFIASSLFDNPSTPESRFLSVLKKLLPYLRKTLGERLVTQKMSETLQLEAKTTRDLLMKWVNSPTHPTQKSIYEFLASAFAESNLNAQLTAAAFPDQFKTFTLLHKIAMLVIKFKITPGQLDWLFEHGPNGGWLDLNSLPIIPLEATVSSDALFTGWERLVALFGLRDVLPFGELGLFRLFDLALAQAPTTLNAVRNAAKQAYLVNLSQRTLWPMEELETLLGPRDDYQSTGSLGFVFPDDYTDERMLLQLRECFKLMKRLGASAKQLSQWGKLNQTSAEELDNAASIKNAVKAKYDDKQWLEVAKPLKDPLREKQRAALVAYLITHPAQGQNWRDANELYEYFLIDVEMDPCMMTTRIKQAISSVQLFIQRCLMNLESKVFLTPKNAQEWAMWRKWYRVWEANRKVLFYPENWIEPELRDDKSPFFQDLENELLQGDVTMDTAEDAFLHYLEKLGQVARLEIVGMYHQKHENSILHVFGRTYVTPHIYFYRRLEGGVWSAWEKVDLDIEGDHLIPVEWNRRLYLFWAIFTEKSKQQTKDQRKANDDPLKYWEIKFAWSEYKNNRWSPKKVSKEHLRQDKYPSTDDPKDEKYIPQEPQDFSFKTRILQGPLGEQLSLECYGSKVEIIKHVQDPQPPVTLPIKTDFRLPLFPHDVLGVPVPTYVKLSILINNQRPTATERSTIKIQLRNINVDGNTAEPVTGTVTETLALNSRGNAYSTIGFTKGITWNLYSASYSVESFKDGGSWSLLPNEHLVFFGDAVADAVADAGAGTAAVAAGAAVIAAAVSAAAGALFPGLAAAAAIGAVTAAAALIPAAGGAVAAAAVAAISRTFGRRVLISLTALPAPKPLDPVVTTETTLKLMQGIGDFRLDDGNGNLVAVPASPPEKFVTSRSPSSSYSLQFYKNGWKPLTLADIDDIQILRTKQDDITTLETFKLNPTDRTKGNLEANSDYYFVSQSFSVLEVNDSQLDNGKQMFANVNLRPCFSPSMVPARLESPKDTKIENMMIMEDPGDDSLSLAGSRILSFTPGTFRLLAPHQDIQFTPESPFFFQDGQRIYFVSRNEHFAFSIHFHPFVRELTRALNRDGIPGLLTLQNQQMDDSGVTFSNQYEPNQSLVPYDSRPKEDVDFEQHGAYSVFNWELFFHIPFLIALQLSKNQRFEEAQKWFHYIFDPTATDSPDLPGAPGIERFWRVKPFYDAAMQPIQTLEALLADSAKMDDQIKEWEANPFKPHVIARIRVVAYMKAVVMRYIDNLIDWGDQLFRRDTIESINEATQLYILAAQILGKRPEDIPARAKARTQTFRTLDDVEELDGLSNAMVEIESFLPPSAAPIPFAGTQGGPLLMPFFCITANDKLLGYWDTVADRLFKIRHCMNIEGVERSLPIFEPPIDPALLVRAAAAGVDIASVLNDINAAVPHYRFNVMLQKANELCNDVKSLGAALLSALEKKDVEELALLRSSHEVELLKAIREIKKQQIEEANNALAGLMKYQDVVTARQQYYLSRPFMNSLEKGHIDLTTYGLIAMEAQLGAEVIAAILHLIPDTKVGAPTTDGVTYGGGNVAPAIQAFGSAAGTTASMFNTGASLSATLGGYQRRQEDWTHQADLATKELEQVLKQIAAAEIRLAISEYELENHDLQIENAKEVDEYLRDRKFTNQELYGWMVGKISGIYFQGYQLAYDVAKRAERTFRYELGLRDSNFIQFGYWDSLKKGLLSGERLHHDLKRMDVAYLDQNKREYEITKHISLITLDPISLIKLKETGECFVSLPEALFDMDYPGHYMRRVKSVSITIPCVTGPYAGVNCTLTQLSSSTRHANTLLAGKYSRKGDDTRFSDSFGTIQSIVTSSGQNDSGLFEANLRDERYLPFEGQGAISTWRIQLPTQFKSFDYDTISDVVLHLRYTARGGGDFLRQHATSELLAAVNSFVQTDGQQGLARIFSLRHEFPTEWHRFLNPAASTPAAQTLTMALTKERFPFLFQDRIITINTMELLVKVKPEFCVSHNDSTMQLSLQAGEAATVPLTLSTWNELLRTAESPGGSPGDWTLTAWLDAGGGVTQHLDPNAIQDMLLVCRYTCL